MRLPHGTAADAKHTYQSLSDGWSVWVDSLRMCDAAAGIALANDGAQAQVC